MYSFMCHGVIVDHGSSGSGCLQHQSSQGPLELHPGSSASRIILRCLSGGFH